MQRIYIVYDERGLFDTDSASVFVAGATSLEEARRDAADFTPCVIFSYATEGDLLVDKRFESHEK